MCGVVPFLAIDHRIMNEAIISDDVKVDENGIFGTLTQKRFEWLGDGEMLEVLGHVSPIPCLGDGGAVRKISLFDYLIWTDQILVNLCCLCKHKSNEPFRCEIWGLLSLFYLIGVDWISSRNVGELLHSWRISSGKTRKALYRSLWV